MGVWVMSGNGFCKPASVWNPWYFCGDDALGKRRPMSSRSSEIHKQSTHTQTYKHTYTYTLAHTSSLLLAHTYLPTYLPNSTHSPTYACVHGCYPFHLCKHVSAPILSMQMCKFQIQYVWISLSLFMQGWESACVNTSIGLPHGFDATAGVQHPIYASMVGP